jgi:hypothetical protein
MTRLADYDARHALATSLDRPGEPLDRLPLLQPGVGKPQLQPVQVNLQAGRVHAPRLRPATAGADHVLFCNPAAGGPART